MRIRFKINQLPQILAGGVTNDIKAAVIGKELKVAMIRCQPLIQDRDNTDAAFADEQPPRCLFPSIAGITSDPDLKRAIFRVR